MPQTETTQRHLELDHLNIQNIPFVDSVFPKKPKRILRALQQILPSHDLVIYQKGAFDFDPMLLQIKNVLKRDIYLSGYWQAYPYISSIRDQLKLEFQSKSKICDAHQQYLAEIQSSNSVMVHIRRGDYVESDAASKFHGTLPIQYYQIAIEQLQSLEPDLHFFIFSDDLPWAKNALTGNIKKTFIEHATQANSAAEELQLMFACKHHIIANSTLSWWGAWLKANAEGKVYAPNRWINDANQNLDHLLPASWNRISF